MQNVVISISYAFIILTFTHHIKQNLSLKYWTHWNKNFNLLYE